MLSLLLALSVVVVVLDDVHEVDIDEACTPTLDAFPGTYYTRAYTSPVCSPTRYAIMYGRLPHRIGLGKAIVSIDSFRAFPRMDSLPEVMKCAGYETYLIGKWHLAPAGQGLALGDPRLHGFDHWWAGTHRNLASQSYTNWKRTDDGLISQETDYSSTVLADEAIRAYTDSPLALVVLSFHAPHSPFEEPPVHCDPPPQSPRERYLSMISGADHELSRLFSIIDWSTTIVVVVGDNGTPRSVSNPRAKGTMYERGVRVPMWYWAPGSSQGTSKALTHLVDLSALLARDAALDDNWEDSVVSRSILFTQYHEPNGAGPYARMCAAVLSDPYYKLIDDNGVEELYDLERDPWESTPLDLGETEHQSVLRILRSHIRQNVRPARRRAGQRRVRRNPSRPR